MMATANSLPDTGVESVRVGAQLLVVLAPLPQEQVESVLTHVAACLAAGDVVIATADALARESHAGLHFVDLPGAAPSWTVAAASFAMASQLAQENKVRGILMLGPEAGSLGEAGIGALVRGVLEGGVDLAMPRYAISPHAGLINSGILYPLTRALFASRVRFPLAIDLGLSARMAERMAAAARPLIQRNQQDALLWPVSEAAVAGYRIEEFDVGPRVLPVPPDPDLNTILPLLAGSLFTDIEARAAFWQRPRALPPARFHAEAQATSEDHTDIAAMLQSFRFAYAHLQEIWSLVLPPNALLGLKRLSLMDEASFRMPESLWARIVYDFLLAYRLRTIHRGHLMGALIPLYLAWVASHINVTREEMMPEQHVEMAAAAFEAEKPYLVARWRWPDRFNP